MANYISSARTNYFQVTDEERYKYLYSGLSAEELYDFTKIDENGSVWHGFGGSSFFWDDPDDMLEGGFDTFIEEVQKILPEDQAFVYMESGHEKLRYVTGLAIVATATDFRYVDICGFAEKAARELLNDPGYDAQLTY